MQVELFIFIIIATSKVLCKCKPKKVKLLDFHEDPKRSSPFNVRVTAVKCPGLDEFYYRWEVMERLGSRVVQTSSEAIISIDGYQFPSEGIFDKDYRLKVSISHYYDMSEAATKSRIFRFTADKMFIAFKGGTEKTHPANTELTVDASNSKDISYPPNEDAFEGNIMKWTINPNLPGISSNTLILKVPGELLKDGQEYNITLTVTRTKISQLTEEQSASIIVKIISLNLPELNLECIRNCIYPHPKETTLLSVICIKNCEKLTYKWTVTPNVEASKIDFGDGFDKILIEPNVFKPLDKVTVKIETNLSHSSYSMVYMENIAKGSCDILPKKGISGITVFKISCKGFKSNAGVVLYMIFQKNNDIKESVMLNEDMSLHENEIFLTEGNPAVIIVNIQDNAFMQEEVELKVEVEPFVPGINNIKTLVLSDNSLSVLSLSLEQFRNKVIQMVSFLLDAINKDKSFEDSVKKDLHRHMAESIYTVAPYNFVSAFQIISILKKLQKMKIPADTLTSRFIGRSIMNSATALHKITYHQNDVYLPTFFLKDFVANVFELASNLLLENKQIEETLKQKIDVHYYDSYDEMVVNKLKIRDDLRELTENIIISLQSLCTSVLHLNVPNQKASLFEKKLVTFTTRRILLSSLSNKTITLSNLTESKVYLPEALIQELQKKYNYIDYQFGVFKKNPFWWHKNSSKRNTDFIVFDLFNGSNRIKTTKNPVHIYLKTLHIPQGKINGTISNVQFMTAHRIELEPDAMLIIVFDPATEDYKVTSSSCYCKIKDFSNGIIIRTNAPENQRTLHIWPEKNKNFIYVCIMKLKASKLEYKGSLATFSCTYWNLKTGKWNSNGCTVKEASLQNNTLMKCECTHLSFFCGEILVPPNQIIVNIEIDFYIALNKNWLMVIIVIGLLLLWFFLLIWTWLKDRNFKNKNFICKLDDNVPGDSHVYLIVVFTGVFLDAGTTADVAFQLIGEESNSRVHLIKCCGTSLLCRDSQDWLLIYTPHDLGKIKMLRIWHNCKGNKPHWYCKRILIQNLKTGTQFCFIIEKWFSLIWGKGKIYREIFVREDSHLKTTKVLFLVKFETQFKDKHLWLSIFTRDAQSNFNNKERISSAISILFLSMLANAMFYGIPRDAPEDSIDPQSSFFISYTNIAIFIESWLVAVLPSILVIMLFRNSAPQKR